LPFKSSSTPRTGAGGGRVWAHYSAPRRSFAVHVRQKPPKRRRRNWGAYYDGKRPVP